ncbi:AAA+ superfamily ATPase [Nanobdella aerobiophila]|uniref:AAA+ superfamily ATPase n=1 Tax=Nanobdella aerobiophila TaxID=2586965 RepID=A0A915SEY8_9ARCH|nr:ATP-binding protein [Nanobdella aerobiophila]BBL45345.1 AAA+ superfamily ATPase [Nanobdella aerobiophila]
MIRSEYPEGKVYLFLDEIQEWKNWDYNIRWLHDVKDFFLYISGSSSTLQSSEIPTKLRGRYISKIIFPISFKELINFEVEDFRHIGKIYNLLEEYIRWGGFPELILYKDIEKLNSLLETVFYRDIIERNKIRNIDVFRIISRFILSNYSNTFTYNSLKNYLRSFNINIDVKTIIKYIEAMRKYFLLFTLERFSYSEKKKLISPKKIYLIDTSFTSIFNQGEDIGRKMENIVFIELLRRENYLPEENILIEVTYSIDKEHEKKVLSAMYELKCKNSIIITWDYEDNKTINNLNIKFIPLWKWLLNL